MGETQKLAPRAKRCLFLGYPVCQKAYKLYDFTTHQMFTSRDVVFHETIFPYESIPSTSSNLAIFLPLLYSTTITNQILPHMSNRSHYRNPFLPSNNPHHPIQFLLSYQLLVLLPNPFYTVLTDLITLPRLYMIMSTAK
jgi:hypothetical protein